MPVWSVLAVLEDLADQVEVLVLLVSGGGDLRLCCVVQGCHCCYGDRFASDDAEERLYGGVGDMAS